MILNALYIAIGPCLVTARRPLSWGGWHTVDRLLKSASPFNISWTIAIGSLPTCRISEVCRIVEDVSIEIHVSSVEPNRILGDESSHVRIVPAGAVVH